MDDMKANPMRYPRMKLKHVKVGDRPCRLSSISHVPGAIIYVADYYYISLLHPLAGGMVVKTHSQVEKLLSWGIKSTSTVRAE